MRWTEDAERLMERVPAFVRPVARRTVEKRARADGRTEVTSAAVVVAMPRGGAPKGEALARLVEDAEMAAEAAADRSLGHELTVCGAVGGCPLAIGDSDAAFEGLRRIVAELDVGGAVAARIGDPVLSHSRCKMTVAGCPNACSEPQIKDVALVARAWPRQGEPVCNQCMACAKACPDDCIVVDGQGVHVDLAACIGCGRCIGPCQTGALVEGEVGWDVIVGGRLGRHPRLAEPVGETLPLQDALEVARRVLRFFVERGQRGERLAAVVDRVGVDAVRRAAQGWSRRPGP